MRFVELYLFYILLLFVSYRFRSLVCCLSLSHILVILAPIAFSRPSIFLIPPLYLLDVMNTADAVGTHGGYQQSNTGNIRGRHIAATQFETRDYVRLHSAVRVAQK